MPWTTPETFTAGQTLTAASMNVLSGNDAFLYTPDSCALFLSGSNQSTANNAWATILMGERYDTNNMHSTTSNTSRITIKTDGLYQISAQAVWANNTTGQRLGEVYLNGTSTIGATYHQATGSFQVGGCISVHYYLVANDYIELRMYQNSGGALDAVAGLCLLSATWVAKT